MRTVLAMLAVMVAMNAAEPAAWRFAVDATGDLPAATGHWWTITATRDGPARVPVIVLAPDRDRSRWELGAATSAPPHADREALARPTMIALMNAGYFATDFRPVGWRAYAGVISGTTADDSACTGFAWIDGDAHVQLTRRVDGSPIAAQWGVQAGPFVIDPGGSHGIAESGGPSARRSLIALTTSGQPLLIAIDHPLTLSATADLLLALPPALGCQALTAALNLDGGPSTTLAVPALGIATTARGPVIDVWRIVVR